MSKAKNVQIIFDHKPYDGHVHKLVKIYKKQKANPVADIRADTVDRWCILCGLTKEEIYFNE